MSLVESLMKTGLTRNESELYMALCREGELTGYEAAKITGIPRANAYQALSGLADKGGAYTVDGPVQHYTAVPVDEYCANVMSHIKEVTEAIQHACPKSRNVTEPYITITGIRHIVDKMKNMINNAKERIYVSMSGNEILYLKNELEEAVSRGLKVVAIVSGDVEISGITVHRIEKQTGQVRLIADSSHVLTGEITSSEDDTCLFSKNRPLVELIKGSLKNEIKLAELEGKNHLVKGSETEI